MSETVTCGSCNKVKEKKHAIAHGRPGIDALFICLRCHSHYRPPADAQAPQKAALRDKNVDKKIKRRLRKELEMDL